MLAQGTEANSKSSSCTYFPWKFGQLKKREIISEEWHYQLTMD
ncbi:hypothetical protein SLEP1_g53129 [Rubroshorea leprosula]|uniref:Uncharacterized protein n=1 Tax=Rubroshorea leprosula TaxID=152421 RepID=A0AAV5MCB9_9ROSI|nr:hypothetical protein SLEP1_g53129 [Rubroshorea leprosula]